MGEKGIIHVEWQVQVWSREEGASTVTKSQHNKTVRHVSRHEYVPIFVNNTNNYKCKMNCPHLMFDSHNMVCFAFTPLNPLTMT